MKLNTVHSLRQTFYRDWETGDDVVGALVVGELVVGDDVVGALVVGELVVGIS